MSHDFAIYRTRLCGGPDWHFFLTAVLFCYFHYFIALFSLSSVRSFPSHYKVYRNDRSSLGGGVFVLVHEDIISVEQPELVTECELEWVKIQLKGSKDLYVGSFYMPNRNRRDLECLEHSLQLLNSSKDRHFILCGDFNCPDIDWPSSSVSAMTDKSIHQQLVDLSSTFGMTQIQEQPTRQGNILDLVFTTNPTLIKSTSVIPGISDHDIVVVDSIIRPHYVGKAKRQVYQFSKSNWDALREKCVDISDSIGTRYQSGDDAKSLWSHFTSDLHTAIKNYIPSKYVRSRNSPPWLNRHLRRLVRKKNRLHKQARKTNRWNNYR